MPALIHFRKQDVTLVPFSPLSIYQNFIKMSNGLQRFKKNKYSPFRKQILVPDAVFKPSSETKQHRWPSYIALHSALSSNFNGFGSLWDNVSMLALNEKKTRTISPVEESRKCLVRLCLFKTLSRFIVNRVAVF